ncbi:MAG: nitroreductase family protein [Burkholderiales bacterium]|nr:nitroreductase family protein [Burkholderiales bacterium]
MPEFPLTVSQAMQMRRSTRAFLPTPIPRPVLEEVFTTALRVPSNCNTQPWRAYVVSGEQKDALKQALIEEAGSGRPPNSDFAWDVKFVGEHRERQFGAAAALYGTTGVERHDRAARQRSLLRNWGFFDAPHAVFFTMERYLGMVGAVDLGIFAQGVSLLLAERGIASCFQGALGMYPGPARRLLALPEEVGILFGMSIGYADPEAPANRTCTERVGLDAAVCFVG